MFKVPTQIYLRQDLIGVLYIEVFREYPDGIKNKTFYVDNAKPSSLRRLEKVLENCNVKFSIFNKQLYFTSKENVA